MSNAERDPDIEILTEEEYEELMRARRLAELLDDRIRIAGFGIGLDGIIGLIPGVGDAFSALMGTYHLNLARKLKLGPGVQFGMLVNLAIDFVVGLVPILGDLFDFGFRSHKRNLKLIEKSIAKKARKR